VHVFEGDSRFSGASPGGALCAGGEVVEKERLLFYCSTNLPVSSVIISYFSGNPSVRDL
jgi:hypothetical protein